MVALGSTVCDSYTLIILVVIKCRKYTERNNWRKLRNVYIKLKLVLHKKENHLPFWGVLNVAACRHLVVSCEVLI